MDLIAACPNHMNPPLSYIDPSQVGTSRSMPASRRSASAATASAARSWCARRPEVRRSPARHLLKGEVGAFYRSNGNALGRQCLRHVCHRKLQRQLHRRLRRSRQLQGRRRLQERTRSPAARPHAAARRGRLDRLRDQQPDARLAFASGGHLVEAKLGFQDIPYSYAEPAHGHARQRPADQFNLRYLGELDWGTLEARAYHEDIEHFMDFGADKQFWYGPAPGGPGRPNGTPAASPAISATCAAGMPMYTEGTNTGVTVKADIALTEQNRCASAANTRATASTTGGRRPAPACGPTPSGTSTTASATAARLFGEWEVQHSERLDACWACATSASRWMPGTVQGYNLDTYPTNGVGGMGNQTRDAAAFNAPSTRQADNNWDMTALARYTPDADARLRVRLRAQDTLTEPVRALHLVHLADGGGDGQLVGDGNGYIGNLDLKPEKAHTVSATSDWHAADRQWSSRRRPTTRDVQRLHRRDALCDCRRTNTPEHAPVATKFVVLKYVNQSARLYGLDLRARCRWPRRPSGEFGLNGCSIYTNGENRDTGDDLYNIMPLNAKLALTQERGGWDNALEVRVGGREGRRLRRAQRDGDRRAMASSTCAAATRGSRCASISASRTCSTRSTHCRSAAPMSARARR